MDILLKKPYLCGKRIEYVRTRTENLLRQSRTVAQRKSLGRLCSYPRYRNPRRMASPSRCRKGRVESLGLLPVPDKEPQ